MNKVHLKLARIHHLKWKGPKIFWSPWAGPRPHAEWAHMSLGWSRSLFGCNGTLKRAAPPSQKVGQVSTCFDFNVIWPTLNHTRPHWVPHSFEERSQINTSDISIGWPRLLFGCNGSFNRTTPPPPKCWSIFYMFLHFNVIGPTLNHFGPPWVAHSFEERSHMNKPDIALGWPRPFWGCNRTS